MLAISVKASGKKTTVVAIVFLFIAVALIVLARGVARVGAARSAGALHTAEGTEDIRAFLAGCGWETEKTPEETLEVLIPARFDDVMRRYNAIQKAQGTDLARYAGKTVTRYTFVVTNYNNGEEGIRANVLVYKGKIIGGDVCSLALDGFLSGFCIDKNTLE